MITGAASADIAILIIDVNEGIKQQTKKTFLSFKVARD